ncbi:uncharacterized protein FOMMEDRAFT_138078 [Fomitiporia mediterranea MF3/22]|uniref:uncharacterized protein n=1 Tax=Fomitiporia mediterranea (strain MF3/22) TaxID=694068 RepID=UPI00044098E4|nr:uncharacterized protein FOMMEDRAFT_138078 [Fomitiporia mediterranea MF3/22]EJD08037.1 hypothetical protein FOMMEDRAFT_138078 [Fomitiporia mediterranea MF3/22]
MASEFPTGELVASPMSATFPAGGLVASPMSATFPAGGLTASPMSATFPAGGVVASPMSATFPAFGAEVHEKKSPRPGMPRKGRRKALLIGIKYYRNKNPRLKSLKGPHHDVREVQRLLTDVFGWGKDCFRVLKDDNGLARNQPTLENIKRELASLVEDARPGDHLFFYFSGHGGQVLDTDGDEDDGMDEVIISCDGEMLVDDELHDILVKPLPAGCHLTALLDCCSSGTSLDLPFNANAAHPPSPQSAQQQQQHFPAIRKHSEGNVVLLSACADAERAYEKQDHEDEHKRVRGMLTKAFIDSLKTRRKSTYDELLTSVRTHLKRKDTMQNPQLSSSRIINMDDYFDL